VTHEIAGDISQLSRALTRMPVTMDFACSG